MATKISLPAGHKWQEYDTMDAMCYGWTCTRCKADFTVVNDQDGSVETEYTPGENPDKCPEGKEDV